MSRFPRYAALVLLAVIAVALLRWSPRATLLPAKPPAAAAAPSASVPAAVSTTPPELLHYADALNAPNHTAREDVQLLSGLIDLYRSITHDGNPVGDNAEITAILTGHNRLGYAFVNPRHPAINAAGELCDRWGTPYFFHQISGSAMQIRSAGPDRRQWTADDIAAGP